MHSLIVTLALLAQVSGQRDTRNERPAPDTLRVTQFEDGPEDTSGGRRLSRFEIYLHHVTDKPINGKSNVFASGLTLHGSRAVLDEKGTRLRVDEYDCDFPSVIRQGDVFPYIGAIYRVQMLFDSKKGAMELKRIDPVNLPMHVKYPRDEYPIILHKSIEIGKYPAHLIEINTAANDESEVTIKLPGEKETREIPHLRIGDTFPIGPHEYKIGSIVPFDAEKKFVGWITIEPVIPTPSSP